MAKYDFTPDAGAALIFLIGYIALFLWLAYHFATHRIKWKSRWSLLFFHVVIRLASQACGIGFSVLAFANIDLFLAFIILGAEGYFTLVLCAFRYLISWHCHNLPSHTSWLEPPSKFKPTPIQILIFVLFLWPIAPIIWYYSPMAWFHTLLILANAAIVFGGSYLSGADLTQPDSPDTINRFQVAKIARTTGQSVFLACNALLMVSVVFTMLRDRREIHSRGVGKIHPTLWILFVVWFPLIARGIWGVLQSSVWSVSYMNPDNYGDHGFTPRFAALENVFTVMTEWLACTLLVLTYYPSRTDKSKNASEGKEEVHPIATA